jgi:hypothetical protein
LIDDSYGIHSSSASGYETLKGMIEPELKKLDYKIDGKNSSESQKVIKSVSNGQSSGEVSIRITGKSGKATEVTVYYDCRGVSLDIVVSNTVE